MPFSRDAWESPEGELDAADFCSVCLIDDNPSGEDKVKGQCKLPVQSRPGAPYNIRAMQAAWGAMMGARGGMEASSGQKQKAARKLMQLY
jgi:hypothetical protein